LLRGTSCRYAPVEVITTAPVPLGTLLTVNVQGSDQEKLTGIIAGS